MKNVLHMGVDVAKMCQRCDSACLNAPRSTHYAKCPRTGFGMPHGRLC